MLIPKRYLMIMLMLSVFFALVALLTSPTQLSLINPSDTITTIGTLEVTKGDVITLFTLFTGTGGLISILYTISIMPKK